MLIMQLEGLSTTSCVMLRMFAFKDNMKFNCTLQLLLQILNGMASIQGYKTKHMRTLERTQDETTFSMLYT